MWFLGYGLRPLNFPPFSHEDQRSRDGPKRRLHHWSPFSIGKNHGWRDHSSCSSSYLNDGYSGKDRGLGTLRLTVMTPLFLWRDRSTVERSTKVSTDTWRVEIVSVSFCRSVSRCPFSIGPDGSSKSRPEEIWRSRGSWDLLNLYVFPLRTGKESLWLCISGWTRHLRSYNSLL